MAYRDAYLVSIIACLDKRNNTRKVFVMVHSEYSGPAVSTVKAEALTCAACSLASSDLTRRCLQVMQPCVDNDEK